MKKSWQDGYPDRLDVWVQTAADDGKASVVVAGQAVWLTPEQVPEVVAHLTACAVVVASANTALALTAGAVTGGSTPVVDPVASENAPSSSLD